MAATRILSYGVSPEEAKLFKTALEGRKDLDMICLSCPVNKDNAKLAQGIQIVTLSAFDDFANEAILQTLADAGVKLISIRGSSVTHIDVKKALQLSIRVTRVPGIAPQLVAEYSIALILYLTRFLHIDQPAHVKTITSSHTLPNLNTKPKELTSKFYVQSMLNFSAGASSSELKAPVESTAATTAKDKELAHSTQKLQLSIGGTGGLYQKTVGIIGTGKVGVITACMLKGFSCDVIAYDAQKNPALEPLNVNYVSLDEIYKKSDILCIHAPLLPATMKMINADAIAMMKKGVIIINTGRGQLMHTQSVIDGLESGHIGAVATDNYEPDVNPLSDKNASHLSIQDKNYKILSAFNNVIMSNNQAAVNPTSLKLAIESTLENIAFYLDNQPIPNEVGKSSAN